MSWTIAELADTHKFLGKQKYGEKFTYQRTLFPAPAMEEKTPSDSAEVYEWAATYVCHESKEENSAQMTSIS
jgi:hypothetical protein